MSVLPLDWNHLSFSYRETDAYVEHKYANGEWDLGSIIKGTPMLSINMASGALNYGQAIFEGLKAYRGIDDRIRVFRVEENSKRLNLSADYACMPEVSLEMFKEAVRCAVMSNKEYIPPYITGNALYIRPILIGTSPVVGVNPCTTYSFIIYVVPVGSYYKRTTDGVDSIILDCFDRAAPFGTGKYKFAGNYVAGLKAAKVAKSMGYPSVLYLDAKEHNYFEEFHSSNFIAITKDGKYLTPKSDSILESITNKSLMQLAKDLGVVVEHRAIEFSEIETFEEIAACGTGLTITPVARIHRNGKDYRFNSYKDGGLLKKLYDTLSDIHFGRVEDKHNWLTILD